MDSFKSISSLVADCPYFSTFLFVLGGVTFFKLAVKTVVVLSEIFLLPGTDLKKFGAGKGAWAVITGASDGIGKEYALQLAKKGFNVLAIARNEGALAAVGEEIEASGCSNVQYSYVLLDMSKDEPEDWDNLRKVVDPLDIGVLVNNVGKSHAHPVYFAQSSEDEMRDILAINTRGTLQVTRIILPGMVLRKRGLILNLSSFSGLVPSPMLATYSASKAFVSTFSDALAEEVKKDGIVVQCLNPYFVVSKLSKIRKPSVMIPTPAAFVRASLAKVGLGGGSRFTGRPSGSAPYWTHSILEYLVGGFIPKQVSISYTHKLHLGIRKRVDAKLAREGRKIQ